MTYIQNESLSDYELGDKIRDCEDGSSLYYATRKKNGNSFFIRIGNEGDAKTKTKFENEKVALRRPAKLRPYVRPIYSSFSADKKEYIVYKHIGHLFGHNDIKVEDDDEDGKKHKALITQFFIYLRSSQIHRYFNSR